MEIKRPFSTAEWLETPEPVRNCILLLEQSIRDLTNAVSEIKTRTEALEERTRRNSQNSNQPPSTDGPFNKPDRGTKKSKKKRGGQKGHPGHRQELLGVLWRKRSLGSQSDKGLSGGSSVCCL